uniref:Uncharacterized protein n=1 Tax=Rhizophora mucronata TaxID=61149 RepID=A0A2P2KRP8_RHIMU
MANVTSQAAATSSGEGLYFAPMLVRGSHLPLVLFQTVTSHLQDAKVLIKCQKKLSMYPTF